MDRTETCQALSLFYCEAAPHLEPFSPVILINKRNLIPRDKMNPDGPQQRSDRSNVKPHETKRLYLESEPLGIMCLEVRSEIPSEVRRQCELQQKKSVV